MSKSGDSMDLIVDGGQLGDEPSANYLQALDMLDNVARECSFVSRRFGGIPAPTPQHYYASVLFTALLTRSFSLLHLAPHSPWADKRIEHWDYASAAGITRTMLELRLAFYYLCVDECSESEWSCRWNVFNLHDCFARQRLLIETGHSEEALLLEGQCDELRDRLRTNAYFVTLTPKRQKHFLKGSSAYVDSLENIGSRAGVEVQTFRWIYMLFSSHVHGLPLGFYRVGEDRGRGLPTPVEEGYTSLCLSFASSLLVRTRDEVEALFADLAPPETTTDNAPDKVGAPVLSNNDAAPLGPIPEMTTETSHVRIEVERTSADSVEVIYRSQRTGECVLRRIESNDGPALMDLDPHFWTVTFNDAPATQGLLEQLDGARWAFVSITRRWN